MRPRHLLACLALWCTAAAAVEAALAEREARLAASLRCLVCQNQTLAESNAPLAADMRRQIREQLEAGRSEAQVQAFFEQRYGAFVRYDPPWRPSTWALWLAPFALLAVALTMLTRRLVRRQAQAAPPLTPQERVQAASWLEGDAP